MKTPILEMNHIRKCFSSTVALDDVQLNVYPGENRGLIGENGSGKSTISTIAAGMQKADRGEMTFQGRNWAPKSMIDALYYGIGIIVQESGTIPGITVAENIFLAEVDQFRIWGGKGPVSRKAMNRAADAVLDRIGVKHVRGGMMMGALDFQTRKLVEIAEVVMKQPQILIVDETTTALSRDGRETLYRIMRQYRDEGRGVIFISHDLDEIISVCDTLTVLRDGHLIRTFQKEEFDEDAIRTSMIGRELKGDYYRSDFTPSHMEEVTLTAEHICLPGVLENVSLQLRKGEIVGIGGLSHCGMHDLGKILFGAQAPASGTVMVGGKQITCETVAMGQRIGYVGSHPDAPAWLRLKFAERECELSENAETYHGWISMGWIQQEQLHIDVLPAVLDLPRRYAFRYLQIEVLDVSSKYGLQLHDAVCVATTSADDALLKPFAGTPRQIRLDQIACHTLRECMQDVFEDGPKRDRRLWMGDLRMQALANYETFRNYDLVKRCLYLFAGTTQEQGRVGACLFTQPQIEVDDTVMFDYSLFYIPTLLDYYKATGDLQTLRELAPTAFRQIELAQPYFDADGLVRDSDVLGWCFVDWNLVLNKQASAQGIYLYCVKAAIEMAQILKMDTGALEADYAAKKQAAQLLWNGAFYVSGDQKQISWASQVWMVLGGAVHGDAALLSRLEKTDAQTMVTPYMYHNYIDALICVGQKEKALQVLEAYWGGMLDAGADTFWELYNPENPDKSPYGGTIVNSYCHAWSCAPAYFLRKCR